MADDRLLPGSLATDPTFAALDALGRRLEAIDPAGLLVYAPDIVADSALYALAWQFDVLGDKGFILAETTDEKRALIKRALELHRHKGTPWALKEVVRAVGFADAEVIERPVKRYHDGTFQHDRSDFFGTPGPQWALFRVSVDLGEDKGISTEAGARIRGGVLAYKNARSTLQHVGFVSNVVDDLELADELALTVKHQATDVAFDPATGDPLAAIIRYRTRHNGLRQHDASTYHGATFQEAI